MKPADDVGGEVRVIPIDAGVRDRPGHARAVDAQGREVRGVAGERHAAGVVAGDDLVGHLVVEHRKRTAKAEPDDIRIPRQGGNRRRVGDHLDGLEGAVGGGLRDANNLAADGCQRIDDGVVTAIYVDEGHQVGDLPGTACEGAAELVGRMKAPDPAHEVEAAGPRRRRGLGPDEIAVVRVVLEDAQAGLRELAMPVAARRADELHQMQPRFASGCPLGEAEHRFAVAWRIKRVTGDTDQSGVGDDEIASTGGDNSSRVLVGDDRPAEGAVVNHPVRLPREPDEVALLREAQERLGLRGPGGEEEEKLQ